MKPNECQLASLKSIAEGNAKAPLDIRFKRFVKNRLSPRQVQALRRGLQAGKALWGRVNGKATPAADVNQERLRAGPDNSHVQEATLRAGDWVGVRSEEEIRATLDGDDKLKGCSFMAANGMGQYCGTVRRVLQPITRFIDEEEGCAAKNCGGLVLLEGVMCSGDTSLGRCDRSCLLFWREEWLEKLTE